MLGLCKVGAVAGAHPDEIWDLHGHLTGINRQRFNAYFAGTDTAVAITVTAATRLVRPVPLAQLRLSWLGFQPPQSFRYISTADLESIPFRTPSGPWTFARRAAGAGS